MQGGWWAGGELVGVVFVGGLTGIDCECMVRNSILCRFVTQQFCFLSDLEDLNSVPIKHLYLTYPCFTKAFFSTKHEWFSFYEQSYLPSKIRLHPSCKIPISLPASSIQSLEGWHGFFLGLNQTIVRICASAVTLTLQGIPVCYRIFWR